MRRTAKPIHYYVEGECEEKLINALKVGRDNKIAAGKVEVFNIIQSPLSRMRAAMLKRERSLSSSTIPMFGRRTCLKETSRF